MRHSVLDPVNLDAQKEVGCLSGMLPSLYSLVWQFLGQSIGRASSTGVYIANQVNLPTDDINTLFCIDTAGAAEQRRSLSCGTTCGRISKSRSAGSYRWISSSEHLPQSGIPLKPGLPSNHWWLQPSASTRIQPSARLPSHRHTCKRVQWSSDAAPTTRKTRLSDFCVEAHAVDTERIHCEKAFSCCNDNSLMHVHYEEHQMARGSIHAESTNLN